MGSNETAITIPGGPRVIAYLTGTGCYRGAGWGARGVCGGLVTRVECGGFDFFLPKKGPTGTVSAGPAGPRRDHAGAKARGAAPAPRRRVPLMPRTVNGTGHTGPSEFCATSI